MSKLLIINADAVTENGIRWDSSILINGKIISEIKPMRDTVIPEDAEVIDAHGLYVGPGFVDIHVHAGYKYSTCFEPLEAANYFLSHGETTILATASYDYNTAELCEAIKCIKEGMKKTPVIKGIYMEGPYINPNYGSNAHNNPWRHPISSEEYMQFADECGEYVKIWAFAPEYEGIKDFLEYARKVNPNVVFALGHSEATPMQIRALGAKYMPKIMTHVTNATGYGIEPKPGVRGIGPDEYCFANPEMYAELISDSCGIHVHPEMQKLILHTKGVHRTVLITDCTVHDNPTPPEYSYVTDLNFDDRGGISGSKITMDKACKNIMTHTNCGIAQAFLMASTNPARVIGMDDKIGSVTEGKIADLVIVDDKFNVKNVISEGEVKYFASQNVK